MYNKVILIGRLTATPEMVKTASDRSFTRVTVAVNRRYKTQNGEREADFITVVVWGRLAETLASYASKGSLISLDGELRTRKYDKDGQTHYVTEVLCSTFQLLESRAQRGALDWMGPFHDAIKPVVQKLYNSVKTGNEAQISIDSNSKPDYREKLEAELKALRESEMWQTAVTVRKLRPENN